MPEGCRTTRLALRPLRVEDVERDYDAVMASAPELRRYSQSGWPADDFTLEENRSDLERHEREHAEGVAFTYTVTDLDGARCLGCVYLVPLPLEAEALADGHDFVASVAFWVRTSEIASDLDRHLLETLRAWLDDAWAFDRVVFAISPAEERKAGLLRDAGLERRLVFTRADGRTCWAYV